jgi:hypothetical protein
MNNELSTLTTNIFASVYGSGNYNTSIYNGSSTGSTTSSSSSSPAATTSTAPTTIQVLDVDTNTPYAANTTENVSDQPTFSGKAPASSTINITIQPGSVLCTTTADANGNWSCKVSQQLSPGDHSVSITATTPSGQVLTYPTFEINASSSSATPSTTTNTSTQATPKASNSHSGIYTGLSIVGILILLAIAGYLLIAFLKKRRNNDQQPPAASGPIVPPTGFSG